MTTIPPVPEVAPEPHHVIAEPGTKLEQLHAAYIAAKAQADEAAKAAKALSDAIKVELTAFDPSERRFTLASTDPSVPSLGLTYVESWRVDTARLKREAPETWQAFAKLSTSWTLKPSGGA